MTGASGFLGWHLCRLAQAQWQVYGTYHTHPMQRPRMTLLSLDLRDYAAMRELFHRLRPDAVIHTAAQSHPNWCQRHPKAAAAINVIAAWNLAGLCADLAIPCVFTSTDLVFDGLHPPYAETDAVCPISFYGEQKVAAELGMRSRHPGVAIGRMPIMYGVAPSAPSFLQPLLANLEAGHPISLFTDEFRTPVSGLTAAHGLLIALNQLQGVIHLGGRERLSRYEFGCLLLEVLQRPLTQLQACRQQDIPMPAPRPPDVSLNSQRAFDLGYHPLSVREELLQLGLNATSGTDLP
nr:NAD(P)-dependent oxidoreductase [Neosynechococcus sphagnicola]